MGQNNSDFKVRAITKISVDDVARLLYTGLEGDYANWYTIGKKVEPKEKAQYNKKKWYGGDQRYSCALGEGGSVELIECLTNKIFVLNRNTISNGLHIMANEYGDLFSDFINGNEDDMTGDLFIQCCVLNGWLYRGNE